MTSPRIGVLGLQGDIREHERVLAELGAQTRAVRHPDQLAGLAGLVIPGGESTTMSKLAMDTGLLEPIRAAVAAGLPTFGTCAGMIMLAKTVLDGRPDQQQFGGIDMDVRRNAFGRQVDSFEADVPIPAIGDEPFRAVFIRAPWVENLSGDVEILARLEEDGPRSGDAGRIVAVRQNAVMTVSFHPELTPDGRLHSMFLSMVG